MNNIRPLACKIEKFVTINCESTLSLLTVLTIPYYRAYSVGTPPPVAMKMAYYS